MSDSHSDDVEYDVTTAVVEKSENVAVRHSERSRTFTEKGFLYQMQFIRKKRDTAFKEAMQKADYIRDLFIEDVSTSEMQLRYSHWMTLWDIFLDSNEMYFQLLSPEEQENDKLSSLQTMNQKADDFRSMMDKWFKKTSQEKSSTMKQELSSRRSQRSSSRRSSVKSESIVSTVLSAKMREEQTRAELLIKAESLKKKRQIEMAKIRLQEQQLTLQLQEEELEIESQTKMADARLDIVGHFEEMIGSQYRETPRPRIDQHNIAPTTSRDPMMNAFAPPFVPQVNSPVMFPTTNNFNPGHDQSSDQVIKDVIKNLKKPPIDIKKFDGNPLEYKRFRRQFESKVSINCDNDDERLNYLEQYTVGEPLKIVTGLSFLDSSVGYVKALEEMDERYGDVEVIVNAYIKKALNWPVIKAGHAKPLDDYSLFLQECQNAVQCLEAIRVLEYADNFRRLVSKLPFHLHDRWRSVVLSKKETRTMVRFHHLVAFVKQEAKKANDPTFGRDAMASELMEKNTSRHTKVSKGSFASNVSSQLMIQNSGETGKSSTKYVGPTSSCMKPSSSRVSSPPIASNLLCHYCNEGKHDISTCDSFAGIPFADRVSFLKTKGFCFGCLRRGHFKYNCHNKLRCSKCKGVHPTVMHIIGRLGAKSEDSHDGSPSQSIPVGQLECHMGAGDVSGTLAIIPVNVRSANGMHVVSTYAFLDPGSTASFVSEDIVRQLGVSGQKLSIVLDTMGSSKRLVTQRIVGLEVSSLDNGTFIEFPPVYSKGNLPVSSRHIPTDDDIVQWKHLEGISIPRIDSEIGLLIGNNVPDAFTPLEIRTGPRGSPYAVHSLLGWIIWNIVRTNTTSVSVNKVEVMAIHESEELHQLSQLYQKSINLDFPERLTQEQREHSVDDKCFLKKVMSSLKLVDGHYEMVLPFKSEEVLLPNNEMQAVRRLNSLQQRLQKNPQLLKDYTAFMDNIIAKGFAELVPKSELQRDDGRVWFIPHHGVYHPHKPEKIRVVFDCAASYQGVSLNNLLLHGPDLTNSLVTVLMKFRMEKVALMADIESMFYQVKVNRKDTDCLRFLWWQNGDLTKKPLVYRMVVHLFGATSSPSCSNVALRQTAQDNRQLFPDEVCDMITSNFYVDDFLLSVPSVPEAVDVVKCVTELCARGGFRLTKWISNSREVIHAMSENERAKELKDLDLTKDDLPSGRALGVKWCIETDEFTFKIVPRDLSPTRRNLLSLVSSIFDPLGFVTPFTMTLKMFLQSLCKRCVPWNDVLDGDDLVKWNKLLAELSQLDCFRIPRCVNPLGFGDILTCQIHHFCDASELGYGVVTYLRLIDNDNSIHCTLLLSKARVAPLKKVTIPRLELSAATLAVRLQHNILIQLGCKVHGIFYWTDSMAVLRYIWNESSRFQTFVANRLAVIHDGSEVEQWMFVSSADNTADDISRGQKVRDFLSSERWIKGPLFLQKKESDWPCQPIRRSLPEDDAEVKMSVNTIVSDSTNPVELLISRFSSWFKLKKIVAWIMMAKRRLRFWVARRRSLEQAISQTESDSHKVAMMADSQIQELKMEAMKDRRSHVTVLGVKDLVEAEIVICQFEQRRFLLEELHALEAYGRVSKKSTLYKLDPIKLDGTLRVGGRIDRADLPYDARHPVILPSQSPVSRLILLEAHESVGHLGRNSILAVAQQRFWIVKVWIFLVHFW